MSGFGCATHRPYKAGCPNCQRLGRLYEAKRDRAIANGTWKYRVPAATVAQHIRNLREQKMTVAAIARAANLPPATVYAAQTRPRYVEGPVAAAILAVQPTAALPAGLVPATPTVRRVRALVAIGYSITEQARRMARPHPRVWELAHAVRDVISVHAAEKAAALFEELSATPGPSGRARALAARKGWLPPLAWDDVDDLTAQPVLLEGEEPDGVDEVLVGEVMWGRADFGRLNEAEQARLWLRFARHRAEFGQDRPPVKDFAKQFGLSLAGVQKIRLRAGHDFNSAPRGASTERTAA